MGTCLHESRHVFCIFFFNLRGFSKRMEAPGGQGFFWVIDHSMPCVENIIAPRGGVPKSPFCRVDEDTELHRGKGLGFECKRPDYKIPSPPGRSPSWANGASGHAGESSRSQNGRPRGGSSANCNWDCHGTEHPTCGNQSRKTETGKEIPRSEAFTVAKRWKRLNTQPWMKGSRRQGLSLR